MNKNYDDLFCPHDQRYDQHCAACECERRRYLENREEISTREFRRRKDVEETMDLTKKL